MNRPSLSPSLNHQYVMDSIVPALRYDGGDVRSWQEGLRPKLRDLLGHMPEDRIPLSVSSLWKRDHPLGTIEKVVYASEPYADIPAYVCLPKGATPPFTFFICVQGHSSGMHLSIGVNQEDETEPIQVEGDRDFALGCMRRGLAALCIEQRGFGELEERSQKIRSSNRCHDTMMQALLLGRTLPGERVFDIDRAIDYLETRGDADMNRLGLMGTSGGGMVTIWAAALLPRLRFAMPASHFCTFRDGVMSIHHCGCCYVPGVYRYAEMADVAGLFAPRPMVIVTGRDDPSKPIAAVRKAFDDLKRIYRMAGAEDQCQLVVGEGGHRFYEKEAWDKMMALLQKG